jgi:chromate transporter
MMNKDKCFYWKLFSSTFYLSAFTFGGGYVIIPLMKKKFVDQYEWIEQEEMLDIAAIAQSSPGAIAVNASILIGYRLAGFLGAFITILGTILPPMITLSIISLFYTAFRDSAAVSAVLNGMQAAVAAVIADVVITMGIGIVKSKSVISILVMICAFAATYFFQVNVMLIILICGLLGVAVTLVNQRREKRRNIQL